jgi:hypothetical protein
MLKVGRGSFPNHSPRKAQKKIKRHQGHAQLFKFAGGKNRSDYTEQADSEKHAQDRDWGPITG